MRSGSWLGLVGVAGSISAILFPIQSSLSLDGQNAKPGSARTTTVVITGNLGGNLSPCGCTKPMSGGIRRRMAAIRSEGADTITFDAGDWIVGEGRQDVLKAQTMAQLLAEGQAVGALGLSESSLGRGEVAQLARLSQGRLVAGGIDASSLGVAAQRSIGPFLVSTWSVRAKQSAATLGVSPRTETEVLGALLASSRVQKKAAVLITDLSVEAARAVAKRNPALAMIVYREGGTPSGAAQRVGSTLLVSPGGKGRFVVQVRWTGKGWKDYTVRELVPEIHDDPAASALYGRYLKRVSQEQLLEKVVRREGDPFSGSASCQSCHAAEHKIWSASRHAQALTTLESDGHGRDPECVICHVVGLDIRTGFRSREETPELAAVGCESCHGAGEAHVESKGRVKLPAATLDQCLTCHTGDTSPKFNSLTYWKKIQHGVGATEE